MMLNLGMWQDRVEVAIKQLRDDRMDNAGGYEKAKDEFFKEARIFKLMNHPNLVQVRILFISGSTKLYYDSMYVIVHNLCVSYSK